MNTIDPDSPRDCGTDLHGNAVELGDTDSDGYFVGYIDADGNCWESRCERDRAIGAGRYMDAGLDWRRTGGVLGSEPDFEAIMREYDVLPEHYDEVRDEIATFLGFLRMTAHQRAQFARLN